MDLLISRVLLVLALLAATRCRVILDVDDDAGIVPGGGALRLSQWATRAHDWLLDTACANVSAAPAAPADFAAAEAGDLCRDLVQVPRAQIRVYAAGRGTGAVDDVDPVMATLVGPEGGKPQGPHDAVLVLDPYPAASFGHLVLVFFVALGTTDERCGQVRGMRLENGDCVQPAREPRCSPGGGAMGGAPLGAEAVEAVLGVAGAPCELLFLPLVTPASLPAHQQHDRLLCRHDVAGFATTPCPQLRPPSQVAHLRCDPQSQSSNTKRCDTTQSIRTRCPFMQTCDHAVLLSGGWNRHLSDHSSLQNVLQFHGMLKHVGFHEDNIKVFFANGVAPQREQEGVDATPAMYPSALKLALRYHVHRLCETARCADTLLLYLNGPALPGGATLLWDADGNGQLDETEVYSARELLRDVSQCGARRVVVVADQSYAKDLVRHASQLNAASRGLGLRNVVVMATSAASAPSASSWTSHWTGPSHRHACLADMVKEGDADAVFLGSASLVNTTLTGMPCALAQGLAQGLEVPEGLSREQQRLRRRYSGCQNLSTREWMAAQDDPLDGQDSQEDEDADDEDSSSDRSRSENNA